MKQLKVKTLGNTIKTNDYQETTKPLNDIRVTNRIKTTIITKRNKHQTLTISKQANITNALEL